MVRSVLMLLLVTLVVAGCGGTPPQTSDATQPDTEDATDVPDQRAAEDDQALRPVTLAMSFIPNVQFAPYYVAKRKGYYVEAGLDVTFDYNFENDVIQRVASWPESAVDFATASGTSVLLARQQDLPVKTVLTLYQEFPVVFFSKAATPLNTAADLQGKQIGLPGRFGESYYALLALLYANDLQESDLNVQEIGFTQAEAVLEDKVDVAIGYAMNEPVLLRQQGQEVDMLRVADIFPLAANGIVVNEQLITEDPAMVHGFVQASLRGLRDTLDDPDEAFDISLEEAPEAQLGDLDLQRQVLQESLPYWYSDKTTEEGLGYTDRETWEKTHAFMREANLLTEDVDLSASFTNEFIR